MKKVIGYLVLTCGLIWLIRLAVYWLLDIWGYLAGMMGVILLGALWFRHIKNKSDWR